MVPRNLKLFFLYSLLSSIKSTSAKKEESSTNDDTTDFDPRIVGGELVTAGTYPWFTMLLYMQNGNERRQTCGGSLVAPEFVLTANHCVDAGLRNNGAVRVGAFKAPFKQGNNGGQDVEFFLVDRVFEHPQYNSVTENNDFTLLKLKGRSSMTPVPLDLENVSNSYATGYPGLWTIGHGDTSEGGVMSDDLKHVQLNYVSNSDCTSNPYLYGTGDITNNMMCARDDGEDSCQGDSGGPLYDKNNNVLVGVVSWGNGCARPRYPGVYARISAQSTWIKSTICNNSIQAPTWCSSNPTSTSSPVAQPTTTTKAPTPTVTEPTTSAPVGQSTKSPSNSSTKHPSLSTKFPSSSTKSPSSSTKSPSSSTKSPSSSTKSPSSSTESPSRNTTSKAPTHSTKAPLRVRRRHLRKTRAKNTLSFVSGGRRVIIKFVDDKKMRK